MGFIGFLLGLISFSTLIFACFILFREYIEKKRLRSFSGTEAMGDSNPVMPYLSRKPQEPASENAIKAYTFEKYVVGKLDGRFRCIYWRGDKYHNGVYPLSNTYPDLSYEYDDNQKRFSFAIECKWRACFNDEAIQWANSRQIDNYYAYQNTNNATVFIVLGVGGSPEHPAEVFIVPLKKIHKRQLYLTARFLIPYKRNEAGSMFFLDTDWMILK